MLMRDGEIIICLVEETAREEEAAAGWHQKTRTPHRDVGNKNTDIHDKQKIHNQIIYMLIASV